jgi:hypothetical protein
MTHYTAIQTVSPPNLVLTVVRPCNQLVMLKGKNQCGFAIYLGELSVRFDRYIAITALESISHRKQAIKVHRPQTPQIPSCLGV